MKRRRTPQPQREERGAVAVKPYVQWHLLEEKRRYSKDREILIGLIGLTAIILTSIFENYTFAALLFVATSVFILLGRQKPKKMTFKITERGILLDDDFIPIEEIKSFNIIDDPGVRARLILKIEKIVVIKEVVPIYDVNIQKIEAVLKRLNIEKEEVLQIGALEKMTHLLT